MTATGFTSAPSRGADELRAQPGQLPGAADEVLVSRRGQLGDLVQPGIAGLEAGAAALRQRQPGLLRAVEHGRGVVADGITGTGVLRRIEQRLPGGRQGRRGVLRLCVGQQGAIERDAQLAGIFIAHGIAHGDHGRHAALEQCVRGAGVAGRLVQRDVLRLGGRACASYPAPGPGPRRGSRSSPSRAGCRRSGRR